MTAADGVALEPWVRALPKAEMHLHFEGAFRWSTIRELHPWGPSLPATPPWLARRRPFPDFEHFRQVFRNYTLPVTGTPELIERHAFEVVEDLARQNVRYAELIVSHDFHTRRGSSQRAVWGAIAAGRDRAAAQYPIDVRLILGLARHRAPDACAAVFDDVVDCALRPGWLAGIDLQGDERAEGHRAFAGVFRRAGDAGLKLRAHAGELAGARASARAPWSMACGTSRTACAPSKTGRCSATWRVMASSSTCARRATSCSSARRAIATINCGRCSTPA
ncbi:MAG: hypothetical protein HYU41_24115 [Candidatus Rokubacteria bacterium]|nr:hypothetical protein [Candidatus Rokubacteria bacterium]